MKRSKFDFLFTVILLSISSPLFANSTPMGSTGEILFWADTATFARNDSLSYVEIYLQLNCSDFKFTLEDDLQVAKYQVRATLTDSLGQRPKYFDLSETQTKSLQWQKSLLISRNITTQNQVAIETLAFYTTPGRYTLDLTIEDRATKKSATSQISLDISTKTDALTISNIQIGRHIDRTQPENRLLKNGFWIAPNVTRTLSPLQKTLPLYYEIYGLETGTKNTFDVAYGLQDDQNRPVKMYTSARYTKPSETCTMVDSLQLPELTPGVYRVTITVRDTDTHHLVNQEIDFWVSPATTGLSEDPIALRRYYEQIRYIASKQELTTYDTLSASDKVRFILKFWKDKDPTPDTPENEFAAEHFRRIKYADETFASRPKQKGSDTDKGRVYIQYGPPTDIERNYFNAIGKDFEIWTYEHINYYQFIFLDRLGDSVLELVHATMPGERHNPHWEEQQIIGNPSDPMAPPAEAFRNATPSSP